MNVCHIYWGYKQVFKSFPLQIKNHSVRGISFLFRGAITTFLIWYNIKGKKAKTKKCLFCGAVASFSDKVCPVCFRPLDREELRSREKNAIKNLDNFMDNEGIQKLFINFKRKSGK